MNKDFHYYGTYCAARIAGYDDETAGKIAFFAQFVDECTITKIKDLKNKLGIATSDFTSVCTMQSTNGMLHKYGLNPRAFRKEELEQIIGVWCPFHFLPGGETLDIIGEQDNHSDIFRLICAPNSALAIKMVNDLIQKANGEALEYTGMVMHVLADTWAHKYFAGVPARYLNDVEQVVDEHENKSDGYKISLSCLNSDNMKEKKLNSTPPLPRENAISYLGHGRMGHLPDMGYMIYTYKPAWLDTPIPVYNDVVFSFAFIQMVYVLKCLKDRSFNFKEEEFKSCWQTIPSDTDKEIRKVLSVLTQEGTEDDICEAMKKHIQETYVQACLPDFSVDQFFEKENKDALERFMSAASQHQKMVLGACAHEIEAYYVRCGLS